MNSEILQKTNLKIINMKAFRRHTTQKAMMIKK